MEWVLGWLARRSLRSLHALGALLGWLVWLLSPSYRRRLHANAAQAGLTPGQRRRSVAEAGKMGTEGLRLWLRPPDDPIADPIEWHGAALIDDALRAGAAIAAPVCQGRRGHPVGFAARFGDELRTLDGDEGARAVLARHRGALLELAVDDDAGWQDIDTPSDLAAVNRRLGSP